MRADGFSEQQIQRALQYVKDVLGAAYHDATYEEIATRFVQPEQNEPWYHYYAIPDSDMWEYFRRNAQLHYNPLEWLRQVKCPVLAIFGASDLLLPVDSSMELFRQSLAQAGNNDVTITVFPHAGHLMTNPANGELAPSFLELIADWLKQRMHILQTGYD
jgi:pimeloyl-ACP methyl ester carboxylesterase